VRGSSSGERKLKIIISEMKLKIIVEWFSLLDETFSTVV
jgi:hypothetical protein